MRTATRKLSMLLVLCMLTGLFGAIPGSASEDDENLFSNGGFELVTATGAATWNGGQRPEDWTLWRASGNADISVTDQVRYSGQYAAQIVHGASSRTALTTNARVESDQRYRLSAWIKTEEVTSALGAFIRTQYYKTLNGVDGSTTHEKVSDGPSTERMRGTNDWTKLEVLVTVPADARYLVVEPFFETGLGKVWFDELRLEAWDGPTGLKLQPEATALNVGDTQLLTPIFTPEGDSVPLQWQSSNENVAAVLNGSVTAIANGSAVITATGADGLLRAQAAITVESTETVAAYSELTQRWLDKLTGVTLLPPDDSDAAAFLVKLAEKVSNGEGTGSWDLLHTAADADTLWEGGISRSNTDSAVMSKAYSTIREMAVSYATPGSLYHHNEELATDIVRAMEWMHTYQYNETKPIVGNWYDWEIGTPQALMDLNVLMYDVLTAEQRERYMKVIDKFVPDPKKRVQNANVIEVGANLLDKALVVVLRGIVGERGDKIALGGGVLPDEFEYATSGDGIYADGSLIQHYNVAYSGAYGSVLVGRVTDLLYLLDDSPWPVDDPRLSRVYNWLENSFESLIYDGAIMDNVKGRSIARQQDSDHLAGRGVIRTFARLAGFAPEPYASQMKSTIKEWVTKDTSFDNYYEGVALYDVAALKAIVNDPAVTPRGELIKHQQFSAMDRIMHLRPGFGFSASMFSDRISAFEFGNGENKKGWYTGIGMTTLYNSDIKQYSNEYWPTVDMFRLPGTTTDGYAITPAAWGAYMNGKDWVGGASIDELYGVAGMDFALGKSTGSKLQGKKSWFMFDDEIVAVGSGITNTDSRKVETIVENRQLNEQGGNKLIADGEAMSTEAGWQAQLSGISWAHLEGNTSGSDIGYYFPGTADIKGIREARTGSWRNVNDSGSTEPITRHYASLAFDHGTAPRNESYSYVLLPGFEAEQTESYSGHPDIEIISDSSNVHAVRESGLGLTAFNFWTSDTADFVRSYQPASVIVKEDGEKLTIAVSDPTQKQNKLVLNVGKVVLEQLEADSGIKVTQTEPFLKLEVDTAGALGGTRTVSFRYDASQTPDIGTDEPEVGKQEIVYVSEDTYTNAGSKAAQNFGSVGYLNVKKGVGDYLRQTWLKYDISHLEGPIQSAKLIVYGKTNDSRSTETEITVHGAASDDWKEQELTWNTMPAVGGALDRTLIDGPDDWRELDVTGFVREQLAGDGTVSLVLQGTNDYTVEIRGKENQAGLYKSYLLISFAAAEGDLNGDGELTLGDLSIASAHYGLSKNSPGWDGVKAADRNGNGKIDDADLQWYGSRLLSGNPSERGAGDK
ncbi:polysaccharide lyase family 8 super-sandwich domain-containing protein [Paenibacillus agaridevorans]|nr:polysaccharide lyase family 8 super-sandwich domain-containing protein [Paenibacillus agaridevorans]